VIAFGASLNSWTTARGAYLEGKRVVQCDADWRRLGARARIDAGVAGDAAVVASIFLSWLDEAEVPPANFRSTHLRDQLEELAGGPSSAQARAGPPALGTVLDTLDAAVPGDRILVLDAGRFTYQAFTRLHVEHPKWFVPTASFGSIGLGMGHAVGAACGSSSRPVLLVAGDGGFMLGGLAEFNTAVRYGLDVIVAICNDGSYGAEYVQLQARGMDPAIATFCWPDLAAVATSLGGHGVIVANQDDLLNLPAVIAGRKGPLLIDVRLDPDGVEDGAH
jgi:acetolactate synthase-1/2/3 large subunit